MTDDNEIKALKVCLDALKGLDQMAYGRVTQYLQSRSTDWNLWANPGMPVAANTALNTVNAGVAIGSVK